MNGSTVTSRVGIFVAVLTVIGGSAAEARLQRGRPGGTPGFTGTWISNIVAAGGAAGSLTVTLSETELKVERQGRNGPMVTTYRLDGAETEVAAGRSGTARATAKWDGDKIIITTKTEAGESTQTWSIDSSGDLKIESTGAMGPVTRTYKKTK